MRVTIEAVVVVKALVVRPCRIAYGSKHNFHCVK